MTFRAIEFPNASDALDEVEDRNEGVAIRYGGSYYVTSCEEADRLEAAGVEFAYVSDYERADGAWRIILVPVN